MIRNTYYFPKLKLLCQPKESNLRFTPSIGVTHNQRRPIYYEFLYNSFINFHPRPGQEENHHHHLFHDLMRQINLVDYRYLFV